MALTKTNDIYYHIQGDDTCCFVYAAYNACLYRDIDISKKSVDKAKKIACCETGSTIYHDKVIKYFGAPLVETKNYKRVLEKGGILTILHPIVNLHVCNIFPDNRNPIIVNSWLAPPVTRIIFVDEIKKYIRTNDIHWVFTNKFRGEHDKESQVARSGRDTKK